MANRKKAAKKSVKKKAPPSSRKVAVSSLAAPVHTVGSVLAALEPLRSQRIRDDMAKRYGIVGPSASTAFGVSMSVIQKLAKGVKGRDKAENHALAAALWGHKGPGQYEARMVAVFVDEPSLVSSAQMDRWAKDFDNWGICDTACFKLFDRVPDSELLFRKIEQWSGSRNEFVKRAAFALLACIALHNKDESDGPFLKCLPLIEKAATDERNFVKKALSWALRAIQGRGPALRKAVIELATRLANSENATSRWIGKDVIRQG